MVNSDNLRQIASSTYLLLQISYKLRLLNFTKVQYDKHFIILNKLILIADEFFTFTQSLKDLY